MKFKLIIPAVLFMGFVTLCSVEANAQNFNPKVQVTNIYEGKLMEVHKPTRTMFIPDSLLHFDLDMKYSVFENPYQGSYEFNPYLLDMKPQPNAYSGNNFYFRAGTGYALRSQVDIIYAPRMNGRFQLSVYDKFRSMFGDFKNLGIEKEGGLYKLNHDAVKNYPNTVANHSGHDFENRLGVEGRTDWDTGIFKFDVGYYTLGSKDTIASRRFDALDITLGVRSNKVDPSYFYYDANFMYRYGKDEPEYEKFTGPVGVDWGTVATDENYFRLNTNLGPKFRDSRILVGADVEYVSYGGDYLDLGAGSYSITPKYVFDRDRLSLTLGAKLGFISRNDKTVNSDFSSKEGVKQFSSDGQIIYPEVHFTYEALKDYFTVYADITGGNRLNTYSSLLKRNHFFTPKTYVIPNSPLFNVTAEKVNASVGFMGNFGSRFNYNLRAGYSILGNEVVDYVYSSAVSDDVSMLNPTSSVQRFGLGYKDYNLFYVHSNLAWASKDFDAIANLTFQNTNLKVEDGVIKPASLMGNVELRYNYRRRIFAGISCSFSSSREGAINSLVPYDNVNPEGQIFVNQGSYAIGDGTIAEFEMPGYVDLGLSLEYKFTKKLSFWLKGGNLLNMEIQRNPGYTDNGIYFSAGLCLNL